MNVLQAAEQYIGKVFHYTVPTRTTMQIEVRVEDFRFLFNRPEVLITPVAGSGSAWVNVASLRSFEREGSQRQA